jgi:hypothetical protein
MSTRLDADNILRQAGPVLKQARTMARQAVDTPVVRAS